MRPQILKDLIGHTNGEADNRLVTSLCNFVDVVVAGEVPPCIRSTFFGANLFAFTKPGGGIRPIAVGLTLRRLVSKFVGHLTKDERSDSYGTVQLGIGTKNGAEAAGHVARALLEAESSPGTVLLKIDFSNAFNSIRWDTLLETVYQRYPGVYNYTLAAYGDASFLMFGDETLLSYEGVQQGDPDGPRLFGDTINSLIQSLQSRFNVWYLDDGNLADEFLIVLGDLRNVIEEGRKCGLVINPAKSELFFVGTESDESRKRILGEFSEVCCGIQTPPLESLTVLGAPIGASAIISCLGDKIAALRILASRLPLLESHHAFYLLKHSFAIPRLTYSLRTAPCFDHPKLLEDYDSVLRSALKDVCNVHIDDSAWVQACLPVRVGGFGLNSTMQLAPSAFLASAAACANLSGHLFDPVVDTPPPTIQALEAWKSTNPSILHFRPSLGREPTSTRSTSPNSRPCGNRLLPSESLD